MEDSFHTKPRAAGSAMAPVRLMYLIAPSSYAGAERVVASIVRNLDREKYEITVGMFMNPLRPANDFLRDIERTGCRVMVIELRRVFEWRQFRELLDVLSEGRIQILHTHSYRSDILGLLAAKRLGMPIVTTLHGWHPQGAKMHLYAFCERMAFKYFDRIIVVSEELRRRMVSFGIPAERLRKIRNAIDTGAYSMNHPTNAFREEYGIGNDTKLVGTIGRLSPEKGLGDFLIAGRHVLRQQPQVKFVIAGDGPEKKPLKEMAEELGIENHVIFCGHRRDVATIYNALDIFVLSSFTEGLPIALLEAAFYAKPIIATSVGGIPEVIENNKTGILVSAHDPIQLGDRISELLSDGGRAKTLGVAAKCRIESEFDCKSWIRAIDDLYEEVLMT